MASLNEKIQCKRKVRYSNGAAAEAALRKIRKPWRVYKCPVCGGYHLSSSRKR